MGTRTMPFHFQIHTIIDRLRHSPASLYSTMSDRNFCRICHEGDGNDTSNDGDVDPEPLISPCKCSGSVGLIHRSNIAYIKAPLFSPDDPPQFRVSWSKKNICPIFLLSNYFVDIYCTRLCG